MLPRPSCSRRPSGHGPPPRLTARDNLGRTPLPWGSPEPQEHTVQSRPLAVDGAWEITPRVHRDERGAFLEAFKATALEEVTGRAFPVAQVNTSVSAAKIVRGIHFTAVPPGQAKYLTCTRGAVLDVVVDLRVGSPTFGAWDAVRLDDVERRAVLIAEGLGHAFCALTDEATVTYLCSTPYAPAIE